MAEQPCLTRKVNAFAGVCLCVYLCLAVVSALQLPFLGSSGSWICVRVRPTDCHHRSRCQSGGEQRGNPREGSSSSANATPRPKPPASARPSAALQPLNRHRSACTVSASCTTAPKIIFTGGSPETALTQPPGRTSPGSRPRRRRGCWSPRCSTARGCCWRIAIPQGN